MANKQQMRFSEAELTTIKGVFAENEDLLKIIRKAFLQLNLKESEEKVLKSTFSGKEELLRVMRKLFLPELDGNAPLQQVIDLWLTIDLKDKPISELMPVFQSREMLIEMIEQALGSLEGKEREIQLSELTKLKDTAEETYVNVVARNVFISHLESVLQQIVFLAGRKDESVEETQDRLRKDSAK